MDRRIGKTGQKKQDNFFEGDYLGQDNWTNGER
jgi:hypothetical protein